MLLRWAQPEVSDLTEIVSAATALNNVSQSAAHYTNYIFQWEG